MQNPCEVPDSKIFQVHIRRGLDPQKASLENETLYSN